MCSSSSGMEMAPTQFSLHMGKEGNKGGKGTFSDEN